jgi:hypothetical protein
MIIEACVDGRLRGHDVRIENLVRNIPDLSSRPQRSGEPDPEQHTGSRVSQKLARDDNL